MPNKSPLPTGFSSTVSPQPLRFSPAAGLDVSLMKQITKLIVLAVMAVTTAFATAELVFPKITGKQGSITGTTDNPAVRCILREGTFNQGTVEGQLIVKKAFIGKGVQLEAKDDNGLVCAWGIRGEEKNGEICYDFILRRTLVDRAEFSLCTFDDKMYVLRLATVPILPKKNG